MPLLHKFNRKARNAYVKTPPENRPARFGIWREFRRVGHIGRMKSIGGIKKFGTVALLLCCVAGVSVLLCRLSIWIYNEAVTSAFFQTKHVDVVGNVRLAKEMVLRYSGIREGENSLSVNIADAEKDLLRTPWVREVSIKRLLPDRFVIKLKERMPSFWLRKDGILYYANEMGEAIAPVESANFLSLPTLVIEQGAEEIVPYLSKMLKDMQSGTLPLESGIIAQVAATAAGAVEIYLEDREMRLSIATDDWNKNLTRMGLAMGDLARRRELQNVRQIRAADGNVWVLFNNMRQG
ncbi:MAG: FtsQ-type POTRA domain-containing protein [Desulfovibrio sp.]|jgi:cell division protein FtsQ|nr:FtsQ-type POTRA domain-containing protein [Desulfovibrio sp.]